MIVADTDVLAYLLLPGDRTVLARRAFVRDPVWVAPPLWRSELRNVLALYVRQRRLALDDAIAVQEEAEGLVGGRELPVDSARVLSLAAETGRSAYDCEFAALAEHLDVPLVTSDRQVLASFPRRAVSLHAFATDAPDG